MRRPRCRCRVHQVVDRRTPAQPAGVGPAAEVTSVRDHSPYGIAGPAGYSGFFGTDLDITLRERGIDTLRLVGDCTNICVLYTAADARNLGYEVEVLREGVTSFDEEAHHDALRELEKTLGAKIV